MKPVVRAYAGRLVVFFGLALLPAGPSLASPSHAGSSVVSPTHVSGKGVSAAMSRVADLPGWETEDHGAALSAFLRFCRKPAVFDAKGPYPLSAGQAERLCVAAQTAAADGDDDAARTFFERFFVPVSRHDGFLTGYFEPEFEASRTPTGRLSTPLLALPQGFTKIGPTNRPARWPDDLPFGQRIGGKIRPLPDRGAIMDGALSGKGLELVYLDKVDAFFIHVQGSARLKMTDGTTLRVGYAGKTGHPYTSIARQLVLAGEGTPEDFTMSGLRAWLKAHPDRVDHLLRQNHSYIFFRIIEDLDERMGPIGALGLPLVPGRSLAVDPKHVPAGLPVYLDGEIPSAGDGTMGLHRLVFADDTGSAIKGAGRADLFVGSGDDAGRLAGDLRHTVSMTLLVPKVLVRPGLRTEADD